MTDIVTEAIRARAEAATPGPWEFTDTFGVMHKYADGEPFRGPSLVVRDEHLYHLNGEFIANARQDIPDLLARVAELEAALAAANAVTDAARGVVAIWMDNNPDSPSSLWQSGQDEWNDSHDDLVNAVALLPTTEAKGEGNG